MKQFFIVFLLFPIIGLSQIIRDSASFTVRLREVHEVNLTKKDLKKKAEEWIARVYNNSNYVTRINTEDNILTKGSFKVSGQYDAKGAPAFDITSEVGYVLDLAFREGRYKIEVKDITISNEDPSFPVTHDSYFMSYPQWQQYWLEYYEDYNGPGKKFALKRIKDTKKSQEMYATQRNYTTQIFGQVESTLLSWNSELKSFMTTTNEDDDW
jgi:hypothetical protein